MGLKPSGEMYLKTIYILTKTVHPVRSIDIAEYMNFSKPSVSRCLLYTSIGLKDFKFA